MEKGQMFSVLEKLILPLMVALLAFITAHSANKLADAQIALQAEQEATRLQMQKDAELARQNEYKINREIKLIEMFWSDVNDHKNEEKQKSAFHLLTLMDHEIAAKLATAVINNVKVSHEIRSLYALADFDVYLFPMQNEKAEDTAQRIANCLSHHPVRGVYIRSYRNEFFELHGALPKGAEIRFDASKQYNQAVLISEIVGKCDVSIQVNMELVKNDNAKSIRLFIAE